MNPADSATRAFLTLEEDIALLTLNDPDRLNALDLPLARRLRELASEVETRRDIKVMVMRGAGRSFCAGADIRMFIDHREDIAQAVRTILAELAALVLCLRRMGKIVLMSVHGAVAGGGLSLVSHADLCIAASGTRFVPAYNRIGLSPDMGATYGFNRSLGVKRSVQAFLCEDFISADVALQWGLVNWVVRDDILPDETMRIARKLAANSSGVIARTKRLFSPDLDDLQASMEAETESILACMGEDAFRSALAGFNLQQQRRA